MGTKRSHLPGLRRLVIGCMLGGAVMFPAAAAGVGVTTDTVVQLDLNWSFSVADNGLTSSWAGTHWEAEMKPTWTGVGWTVQAWYRHLDGPHGELAEGALHNMGSVTFLSGAGGVLVMPTQDHDPPTIHAGAHSGFLAANGPAIDPLLPIPPGFAREFVTHVPEPSQGLLLLAGLAALAVHRRRSAGP